MYYNDTKINFLNFSKVKIGNIKSLTKFKNTNIKPLKETSNNSYIQGQSFNKKEDEKYNNITYIIENLLGHNIIEYDSTDGSFIIEDLKDHSPVNLIVVDNNNTYNGKYIKNIVPQLDYSKAMKIIRIYQINNTAHIKIIFNGDPSAVAVFAQNATVEKIDTENYRLKGITGPYTVTLHDYIDNVLYTKESTFT